MIKWGEKMIRKATYLNNLLRQNDDRVAEICNYLIIFYEMDKLLNETMYSDIFKLAYLDNKMYSAEKIARLTNYSSATSIYDSLNKIDCHVIIIN